MIGICIPDLDLRKAHKEDKMYACHHNRIMEQQDKETTRRGFRSQCSVTPTCFVLENKQTELVVAQNNNITPRT